MRTIRTLLLATVAVSIAISVYVSSGGSAPLGNHGPERWIGAAMAACLSVFGAILFYLALRAFVSRALLVGLALLLGCLLAETYPAFGAFMAFRNAQFAEDNRVAAEHKEAAWKETLASLQERARAAEQLPPEILLLDQKIDAKMTEQADQAQLATDMDNDGKGGNDHLIPGQKTRLVALADQMAELRADRQAAQERHSERIRAAQARVDAHESTRTETAIETAESETGVHQITLLAGELHELGMFESEGKARLACMLGFAFFFQVAQYLGVVGLACCPRPALPQQVQVIDPDDGGCRIEQQAEPVARLEEQKGDTTSGGGIIIPEYTVDVARTALRGLHREGGLPDVTREEIKFLRRDGCERLINQYHEKVAPFLAAASQLNPPSMPKAKAA